MGVNILCIGNSFSVDTTWHIPAIARALGMTDFHFGNLYVGGCSISMHLAHLQTHAPVYKFYGSRGMGWSSENEVSLSRAIGAGEWDWICIQHGTKDGSRYSDPASYSDLPALIRGIKALAPGAKLAFNMTWVGDQNKPRSEMPRYKDRQEALFADIAALTGTLVAPLVDRVLPTGTAVENFRRGYAGSLCRDGYHLSRDLGRYVAGLAFLTALTGRDISGLTWSPVGTEAHRAAAIAAVKTAMAKPWSARKTEGKTIIHMIRHGQSEANLRDAFLGHLDLPLTQQGIAQAELAADFAATLGVDAIYSSDLSRAYETAKRSAARLSLPITKNPDLREVDAGLWDNMTFDELWAQYPETFGIWANDIGRAACDGGETVDALRERVVSAVKNIARANAGKRVLIFAHGTPIRIMGCLAMGKPLEDLKEVPWAANASTSTFEYENGQFRLVRYSYDAYMGDLVTKLPEGV